MNARDALFLALGLMLSAPSAHANRLIVNSTADNQTMGDGMVTLREAILAAEMDTATDLGDVGDQQDVIDLSGVTGEINLLAALPVIMTDLIIVGPGESVLTIRGGSNRGMWFIDGGDLKISGLSLADGLLVGGPGGNANIDGAGGGAAALGAALMINQGRAGLFRTRLDGHAVAGGQGGLSRGSLDSSFGGTGGGGYGSGGGNDAPGPISIGSNGGGGGPFGTAGGNGSTGPSGGQNGPDGGGGGGGGSVGGGSTSRGGDGGFAGGGGGAGSTVAAAGPAGAGGFGGGGGGGSAPSSGSGSGVPGGAGGAFAGSGGAGMPTGNNQVNGGGGGGGAGLGGAVFVRDDARLEAFETAFENNQASGGPGGVSVAGGQSGQAGQGKGGALFVSDSGLAILEGVTFSGNSASNTSGTATDNDDIFGTSQSGQFVWIEVPDQTVLVSEASGTVQIPITLMTSDTLVSEQMLSALMVHRDGDAEVLMDYDPVDELLVFPAGSSSGTELLLPVTILSDALMESDEQFAVEVAQLTGGYLADAGLVRWTILDGVSPDLAISINGPAGPVAPGDALDFTLIVTNEGDLNVTGVQVTTVLPPALINGEWTCVASFGAVCSSMGTGDIDDLASMEAGSSLTYLLQATVSAEVGSEILTTAAVQLPLALVDVTPGDNSDSVLTTTVVIFRDGFEASMP